jgi:hypothetical protein
VKNSQITTPEQLLRHYQEGRITPHGLILTVLSHTGKRRLTKMLDVMPEDVLRLLKDFVDNYRPGIKVFRGPHPKALAVRFVREWFHCAARTN